MPQITYIEHNGTAHVVTVDCGFSVMEGAVRNGIPGIDADCGGGCACGTCRVTIDAAWRERVGEPSEMEEAMLELSGEATEGARLSCQIPVVDALDGLVVEMPVEQFR